MIYNCIGIQHNTGNRKADGKPFDFYSMTILLPVSRGREGYGYYAQNKFISKQQFEAIAGGVNKFPATVDLDFDINGRITDVKVGNK